MLLLLQPARILKNVKLDKTRNFRVTVDRHLKEAWYWVLEKAAGLLMFNPPDRAGKANKRLSRSLGASLPNSLGSRVVLILDWLQEAFYSRSGS